MRHGMDDDAGESLEWIGFFDGLLRYGNILDRNCRVKYDVDYVYIYRGYIDDIYRCCVGPMIRDGYPLYGTFYKRIFFFTDVISQFSVLK